MFKASIITAVYNGQKTIEETIESLLKQTEQNIEIIVVDDGSTDNSAEIVKSLMSSRQGMRNEKPGDDRIKYFYQKNSGSPAGPKNIGIKNANGEFIGFCDQDDIYYPEKIERQIKAYNQCKEKNEVGIIISSIDLIDESGKKVGRNIKPLEGFMKTSEARAELLKVDIIRACSALVPKKVLDEIGLFDESLKGVDDYDLWLRISEKYGILTVSEPLCAWRLSEKSLSANKTTQYLETEKIFAKFTNSEAERIGHGRNLTRIFLSYVLDKNFDKAKEYCDKAREYPLSKKINFLIKMFDISHDFSYYLFVLMRKIGIISL